VFYFLCGLKFVEKYTKLWSCLFNLSKRSKSLTLHLVLINVEFNGIKVLHSIRNTSQLVVRQVDDVEGPDGTQLARKCRYVIVSQRNVSQWLQTFNCWWQRCDAIVLNEQSFQPLQRADLWRQTCCSNTKSNFSFINTLKPSKRVRFSEVSFWVQTTYLTLQVSNCGEVQDIPQFGLKRLTGTRYSCNTLVKQLHTTIHAQKSKLFVIFSYVTNHSKIISCLN